MLFTIITATYNACENISFLYESLKSQTYQNFEWIIQDGASSDNTLEFIDSYKGTLDISLESKKDTGIYDAWNSAIKRIKGEWVIFLGADDILLNKTSLEKLALFIKYNEQEKNITEETIYVASSMLLAGICYEPDKHYLQKMKKMIPFPYPALLHNAKLFKKYNYDSGFRVAGDYDFLIRTISSGNIVFYPRVLCKMGDNGISNTRENALLIAKETYALINKYFGEKVAAPAYRHMLCLEILAAKKEKESNICI